ncbi:RRP15-like protein [Rhopilema esculentum]|uniref:RRP15-like protein n=1 Tax=Rhopilema esculentum TaxID=499914 RepID=UPI0031D0520F
MAVTEDHMDPLSGDEADVEDEERIDEASKEDEADAKKKNIAGMNDVISKILGKAIKEDEMGVVLSKYKEGKKRKQEKEEEDAAKKARVKTKTEFREKNHVVPDRSNAEKEVALRKIGTKGVVKLFNAVTKHQKEVDSKLKKATTEVKKDKVIDSMSKTSFLDMLKTNSSSKKALKMQEETMAAGKEAPAWDILRDDFMMGSKMKDWDKDDIHDDDDGDDGAAAEALESSDDNQSE